MNSDSYWNIKKNNIQFYNKTAKTYNLQYSDEQIKKYQTVMDVLDSLQGLSVLDIGIGTGLLLEVTSPECDIIGVDCSKNMLRQAKHKYKHQLELICADADYLPFIEHAFDIVFSFTLFQNMPDPINTMIEISRVVKKNSKIIISAFKKVSKILFFSSFSLKHLSLYKLVDNEELKDYLLFYQFC